MTVKQLFLDVSSYPEKFRKKSLKVTRQWSEVTRPLDDCQTTFFRRFKQFGKILKKVTEGHATVVGGHATVVWLSINVFLTFQAIRKNFEKSYWRSRDSGRRSRNRWMTVKQRFQTFQAIRKNFEKSHWTVTRQWSEVTRLLNDCQTTFFRRVKQFGKIWKNRWTVTRQWSEVTRRLTVKQRFFDVSSRLQNFWKKSLNGHATVVWVHATVDRLSNNVFSTFQAIRKKFWNNSLNVHATVVGRSCDRRLTAMHSQCCCFLVEVNTATSLRAKACITSWILH